MSAQDQLRRESWQSIRRLASKGPCKKITYRTKRKAVVALDRIHANDKGKKHHDIPRSAYRCRDCGFWHLTSLDV